MSQVELVERLTIEEQGERWLVRVPDGEPARVAWVFAGEELSFLRMAADESTMWVGPLHPRVAQLHAIELHEDRLVVVIDDDRGPSLVAAALSLSDPGERERWAVSQVIALGDGLATMRQRDPDFVHRRLSFQHVIVDASGHARLSAPISRITQGERRQTMGQGRALISSAWMASLSPEQCRGLPLTPASDVFSLATLLFHAITGVHPFRRDSDFPTLEAIIRAAPPAISFQTPSLSDVLARAFAKDPADRIPSPGVFAGELWRCIPDAAEYDEVISDRIAAWWPTAPSGRPSYLRADGRCRLAWSQLSPTATPDVRHCSSCRQDVIQVSSFVALASVSGRCVSYTGG